MAQVTVPVNQSVDDRGYDRSGTTYPPTGAFTATAANASIFTLRSFVSPNYLVRHLLLAFDTGAQLPDQAVVRAATLRVHVTGRTSATTDLGVVWDWFAWTGTATDWTNTPATNAYSTPKVISTLPASGLFDFVLENAAANVSLAGKSYLRSHVTQHPADAAPTRDNSVGIASFDNTSSLPAPTLIVDYELPQALPPNAIVARINLPNVNGVAADDATALAAIDEDPESPDAQWLTAP